LPKKLLLKLFTQLKQGYQPPVMPSIDPPSYSQCIVIDHSVVSGYCLSIFHAKGI